VRGSLGFVVAQRPRAQDAVSTVLDIGPGATLRGVGWAANKCEEDPSMKRTWSRIIVIVVALAAAGLAAGGLAACGCSTTSSSPNASASPTAGSSVGPSAVQQSAIAVAGGKDSTVLAAVSPDGAAMQLDPGDGHPIRKLAWSPDGTRVAMLKRVGSGQDDTSAVFVYDLATRTTTQIVIAYDMKWTVADFAWLSPTQVAFSAFVGGSHSVRANAGLYVGDATTGHVTPLNGADGKQLQGVSLSASADGRTLAFTRFGEKSANTVAEDLLLLDMASKSVTTIASGKIAADVEGDAFANQLLSPDASLIFTEQTGSDVGFTVTIYSSGGDRKWRSEPMSLPTTAAWDPTGSERVVFGGETHTAGGSLAGSILVYDPANAQATLLSHLQQGHDSDAFAWSPDGTTIAYTSIGRDPATTAVWTVSADGKGAKLLLKDAIAPSWGMVAVK